MSQYAVGQQVGELTVTDDQFMQNPDGSTFEQVTFSDGTGLNIPTPSAADVASQQSVSSSLANLANLVASLSPGLAQAQADVATLQQSTDPLAPILLRVLEGLVAVTNGVADALTVLQLVTSSERG